MLCSEFHQLLSLRTSTFSLLLNFPVLLSTVFHNVDCSLFSRLLQFNTLLGFLLPPVSFSHTYVFVCLFIYLFIFFSCCFFFFLVFKMNFGKGFPLPVSSHHSLYIHCMVDLISFHCFNNYLIDVLTHYNCSLDISNRIEVEVLTIYI